MKLTPEQLTSEYMMFGVVVGVSGLLTIAFAIVEALVG